MFAFYLGQRLSTKGNRCTVRYVGEVQGKPGQWLGVEWDDPTRGKHSGTHDGHEYFKCRSNHSTPGSFIRPTTTWDEPRNFIEGLKFKYAATRGDSDIPYDPDVEIVRISGKTAEEIGFDKIVRQQSQLHNLRIVVLDNLLLRHGHDAGADQEIAQTCPGITTLDLGRNLFETLTEIASICVQLDQLRALKLDGNRLRDFAYKDPDRDDRHSTLQALSRVTSLELDNMLMSIEELDELLVHFDHLEHLSASSNQFGSLDTCRFPQSLLSIDLEDNSFTALTDVSSLNMFCIQLRTLNLKNNKIERFQSGRCSPALPPSLADLDLSYNNIHSWDIINDLGRVCPRLKHLRVSQNPLFENLRSADGKPLTSADGYMLTIARLPNLESLNYSIITEKERLNAETYYLSQIAKQLSLASPQEETDIIAQHPRYRELCEEYGEPVVERQRDDRVDPNSLAARLVECRFYFRSGSDQSLPTRDSPYVVELPKSLSIYAVLGLVGKQFNLLPMRLRLTWESGEKERLKPPPHTWNGVQEWDSSDEEADDMGGGWQDREVELIAGTRPLGTWIEGSEVVIRVNDISA